MTIVSPLKLLRQGFWKRLGEKLLKSHNKIFIIPTRYGFYFISIVFVLFLISLSYGHSLAYTTTFIFVSLVMTSAHFTNFNMAGIEVLALHIPDEIHAGESFDCRVTLRNTSRKTRFDIEVSLGEVGESSAISIESGGTKSVTLKVSPLHRGQVSIKRLRLATTFPFGLFYAWKFWLIKKDFIVYPALAKESLNLPMPDSSGRNKGRMAQKKDLGADEFLGHQTFEDGMPFKGIDWKAYARGKGLLFKTFVEEAEAQYILRASKSLDEFNSGDESLENELTKLSSLVDQASAHGVTYALALEGNLKNSGFGRGRDFKRDCLRKLALFKSKRQVLI